MEDTKQEKFETGEQDMITVREKILKKNKGEKTGKSTYIAALMILIGMAGLSLFLFGGLFAKQPVIEPEVSSSGKSAIVLVSDIGGTNCRFKLVKISTDSSVQDQEIAADVLKPWEYNSIEEIIKVFLKPFVKTKNYPSFAVIGVPTAIINNTMQTLVNIPQWKPTNGDELGKKLSMKKFLFINDFVINGYGIQGDLKEGVDFVVLNNKPINNNEKKFVLGPGTGLGMCYLIKNEGEKHYNVYGSEGSHADFAPKNFLQFKYMKSLESYFSVEYASSETACAGPSIIPMYQYLQPIYFYDYGVKYDEKLSARVSAVSFLHTAPEEKNEINKQIVEMGLNGKDPLAKKVLEFFVEILGNIAGNMSLHTLPFGGIYIVGGLSKNLREIYESGIFQKALLSRGEQNNLLKDIPIILVLKDDLGMSGAIEAARITLDKSN